MTRTSVVVVAYRSRDHLARGLPTLLDDPSVGDVVVVDNSSDPGTADLVGALAGRARYVDPGANLGFARACNLGAAHTTDPVLTFLNPDVVLGRSLNELVLTCLAAGPTAVVAGGLTDGRPGAVTGNSRRRVTPLVELGRAALGARVSTAGVPPGEGLVSVDQVDGALLVLTRESHTRLGGFDEQFELYYEDVELCARARVGGRVLLDTRVWGTHAAGASSRTAVSPSYLVFRVSRTRYLRLAFGRSGVLLGLVCVVVELVSRSVARQPEGRATRLRALRLVVRESRHPGSVRVLS